MVYCIMLIERESPFSGNKNVMNIDVTEEQIASWQGGQLIQEAMPNLSADERESKQASPQRSGKTHLETNYEIQRIKIQNSRRE